MVLQTKLNALEDNGLNSMGGHSSMHDPSCCGHPTKGIVFQPSAPSVIICAHTFQQFESLDAYINFAPQLPVLRFESIGGPMEPNN